MDKIRYCTIVSFAIIIFASMMPNSLALNTESWDGQLASRALTVETDWVIDSWMKIANEDYVLKGNLTITATGNLTLVNSTLTFQPSGNYTYGIFIEAGGQLHTTDLDDDPDTADDYSVIKTNATENHPNSTFILHAYQGSELLLQRTYFLGVSIVIESDNNTISHSFIADSNDGVIIKNCNGNYIYATEITNCTGIGYSNYDTTDSQISAVIDNCGTGIYFNNSSDFWVSYSNIHNNSIGLTLDESSGRSRIVYFTDNDIGIQSTTSKFDFEFPVLTHSPIQLSSNSEMTLIDLYPIPPETSYLWKEIMVDNTSKLNLDNWLGFNIKHEDYIFLQATHNITVLDNTGKVVYQTILELHRHSFEFEPIKIINGEILVFDPYTIFYDDGSNRLNKTFSVFNITSTVFINGSFKINLNSFVFNLESNRAPWLRNHSVTPDNGDEKTSFVFYVEYLDLDGDEPLYVNLVIENDTYEMNRFDDNNTPVDGLQYRIEFLSLDGGELHYYFGTDDGRGFGNSNVTFDPNTTLPVEPIKDKSKDEEDSSSFSLFIFICFSMMFIFIVFMVVMGYLTQKKVKKMGGVEPGTLPEDLEEQKPKEKMKCSECGGIIDADSEKCSKCGEVFDGEEYQCPKCNKLVPEEAEVCKYCGNKFLTLGELESERVKEEERRKKNEEKKFVDKIYCSECGAVVDESMSECPGCGEKFEPGIEDAPIPGKTSEYKRGSKDASDAEVDEEVDVDSGFICSVCGATVKKRSSKCPKCGTEFE